jgi:uncharacterized cupin superfamily protein
VRIWPTCPPEIHVIDCRDMTPENLITKGTEAATFVVNPINPSWILEGKPVARLALLSSSADGAASTYFWDCTAGRFNWYYSFDETLYILEGSVSLKYPSGATRRVSAGDTIFFPVGSSAEWTIDEYVRKLAFCRTPIPRFLTTARQMARRLKRIVTGGSGTADAPGLL